MAAVAGAAETEAELASLDGGPRWLSGRWHWVAGLEGQERPMICPKNILAWFILAKERRSPRMGVLH